MIRLQENRADSIQFFENRVDSIKRNLSRRSETNTCVQLRVHAKTPGSQFLSRARVALGRDEVARERLAETRACF